MAINRPDLLAGQKGILTAQAIMGPSYRERQEADEDRALKRQEVEALTQQRQIQTANLMQEFQDRREKYNAGPRVQAMLARKRAEDPTLNNVTYGDFNEAAGRFTDDYATPFFNVKHQEIADKTAGVAADTAKLNNYKLQLDNAERLHKSIDQFHFDIAQVPEGPARQERAKQLAVTLADIAPKEILSQLIDPNNLTDISLAEDAKESHVQGMQLAQQKSKADSDVATANAEQTRLENERKRLENERLGKGLSPVPTAEGQNNIDPLSPEGIKARLRFEQLKPKDQELAPVLDAAGNAVYGPKVAGARIPSSAQNRPPSEGERTAFRFYERMKGAVEDLSKVEPAIEALGLPGQTRLKYAPNVLQSEEGQLYQQAQRAFTEARLRKDSGAAIPPSEYENDRRTYFIQPGDSAAVKEQKLRSRGTALEAIRKSAGRAYEETYGELPGKSAAPNATVKMKAPNGQVSEVPANQVEHYKSLGATIVK